MDFDVGKRLKEIRLAAGLSQRELAERAGVTHGLISMIEQNKSSPSVASLRKILGGVSMTMAGFFHEETRSRHKVFFCASELIDLTSRLSSHTGQDHSRLSFRQVGDAQAHDLQILHERYEPGADTGTTMLEHNSREGGIVVAGELEVTVHRRECLHPALPVTEAGCSRRLEFLPELKGVASAGFCVRRWLTPA
jgi:transcriptional regulator with XRE-family HTH domain